jgi:parallel beta-helix repeat protein
MRISTLAVTALACAVAACDTPAPAGLVAGGASQRPVVAVAVDPPSVTLAVGGTTRLTAVPKDGDGNALASTNVKWTSSDTSIALVSDSGVVTARKLGTSNIKARAGGIDGSSVVVVTQAPVASVIVVLASSLLIDQSTLATAQLKDATGALLTDRAVAWVSSNPSVATVSESGLVTGVAAGPVTITAISEGVSGTDTLSVESVPVDSISVMPTSASLEVGKTLQLVATTRDASGSILPGRPVAWTSSAPAVATVSTSGVVTAVSVGTVSITATSEEKGTAATITVTGGTTPPPITGIPVYPGESIQAKVDAAPAGTTFIIKPGTHTQQSVRPKDGNVFAGEPGAVLDGQGAAIRAFAGNAKNVVIKGLIIEHYAPGSQKDAIYGATSVGWLVEGNEFRYNDGGGLHTGKGMRVLRNVFHHNAQTGLGGDGDSVLVEGNEIAFNNHEKVYDYTWEAGGAKFVRTRWLTLRNNYVHDNWGPGLWIDIDCWTTLIENNRVENNAAVGIFVEISYKTVVRNNTAKANGFNETWVDGAGIEVNSSPDVEVYGNTVTGNRNGIMALEGNRGTGAYGPYIVQNLHVHDNTVDVAASGVSGFAIYGTGTTTDVFSSARNNRFTHNIYWLGSNTRPFNWQAGKITDVEWRGLGMDVTGTFNR